ncbi:MAG: aminoglycoside phosphotransferase family protein [Rickettsiales bacterium]|jgi:aminoglycoside phosphotransferase (APT) family kinase protein|nr:aminoglycoside phosphotransferase family protein [Rickettsiales bacterium]
MKKDSIKDYLKNKFPNSVVSFIGEGWTSYAFSVDNEIFRFPKYSIEWYERESQILSIVKKFVKIEIPEITIINDNGLDYSVHRPIAGKHWSLQEYENLKKAQQDNFANDCANFLYDLHRIPLDEFKYLKPKPYPAKPKFREKEEIYPLLLRHIPQDVMDKIYNKYRIVCEKFVPDIVFLHKDFEGKNSVVNNEYRLSGVFDFGNSDLGDRTREFAFLYNPEYPKFLTDLLIAYEKVSGIKINIEDVKNYMFRSIINSMPELYDPELASIQQEVVKKRCKKIMFFA